MVVKPGYKQTEAGVIPEEWEVKRLGDVVDTDPENLGSDTKPAFTFKYIALDDVDSGFLRSHSEQLFATAPSRARRKLRPNDVLVSTVRPNLQSHLLFKGEAGCWVCSTGFCVVRCREGVTHPGFVFFHLFASCLNRQIDALLTGSNYPAINSGDVRTLEIPFPPHAEQGAIAEALNDVDELLGGLDWLIAKKRDLKQAAMQQLLTGQTRLPGFHGEWEDAQVRDVIAGFFCGPSPTCEERNIQGDDEWGVLKTTAATKENGWDSTKHKTLPRVFWNKPQIELKKGDVIVTKAGPRHRVGVTAWIDYVPPRIIPSGKMIALRPRPDKVVPLMLAAAISARDAQTYLDQRTTGMAESQVNFENIALLEAPITIPRIEEQTAIAEVLTEMDLELAMLEQRREKTRALKQAMMQELLTGRTRLV